MATASLTQYTCDECGNYLISEVKPRGWVRLLSTKNRDGSQILFNAAPVLYSPSGRVTTKPLPEKAWWCSAKCLSAWVHRKAEEVIERAKIN